MIRTLFLVFAILAVAVMPNPEHGEGGGHGGLGRALTLRALVDLVAMADREYYCQDCETAHAASLWYVHQVNKNYGPPMADYLCGTAYVRLPHIEQRGWALLI